MGRRVATIKVEYSTHGENGHASDVPTREAWEMALGHKVKKPRVEVIEDHAAP